MVSHVRAYMVLGMIVSIASHVGAHTLHTKDRDSTEIGQNSFEAQVSGKEHFFSDQKGFVTKYSPTKHEHDVGSGQGLNGLESSKTAFVDAHPYVPPGDDDERAPCPIVNALANHGFINHSGKDVDLFDLIFKASEIFDFEPEPELIGAAFLTIEQGQSHKAEDGVTDLLNLEQLWSHQRESSLIFKDKFEPGEKTKRVDRGLLNELLCLSPDSDFLTFDDFKQFGFDRIIDSRLNNPDFHYDIINTIAASDQFWFPLVVSGTFDLSRVHKEDLNQFLGQVGKLPSTYIPRFMRDPNFIPFFAPGNEVGFQFQNDMRDNVLAALNANLTDYEDRRKETASNKVHHFRGSFHQHDIA